MFEARGKSIKSTASAASYGSVIKEAREYSLIRIVVDQTEKAVEILKQARYWVNTSDVLVMRLDNRPGKLSSISKRFGDANININYVYGSGASDAKRAIYVFRVPDVERALSNSYDVLRKGGRLGFNYLDTILVDGRSLKDMVKESKPEIYPYGRGVNDVYELPGMAKEAGFQEIAKGILKRPISLEEAISFYSIPAQSAGLFPREELEERRAKVKELFEHAKGLGSIEQCWGWWVGEKPPE